MPSSPMIPGFPPGGWPSLGAVLSKTYGPRVSGIAPAIDLVSTEPDQRFIMRTAPTQAGYLGTAHTGFEVDAVDRKNLVLNGVSLERLADRRSLLSSFDSFRHKVERGSVTDGIDEVFRLMGRLGAKCIDVEVPGIETANEMTMLITAVEGAALHEKKILEDHSAFGEQSLARLLVGFFVPAQDYYNALANRASSAKRVLTETFEKVDAIITPVWPYPLPTIEESDLGANPDATQMLSLIHI